MILRVSDVNNKNPLFSGFQHLQRDSNSRFNLERVASWSPRRWRLNGKNITRKFHFGQVKMTLL